MALRIVGGALGGRRFAGPISDRTRPTSERVREALASKLDARGALDGATVLDLFAGTGALAFEALSRGAGRAVLVDHDRRVLAGLRRSASELGLLDRVAVRSCDLLGRPEWAAARLGEGGPFDLVFADPPYAATDGVAPLVAALDEAGVIAREVWLVVEHAARRPPPALEGGLEIASTARYGDTAVTFYSRLAGTPDTR